MTRNITLALAFLFIAGNLHAQEVRLWDIEACIDYAISNNLQVKQGDNQIELNRLDREQAKNDYLPSLNANSGTNSSFGRSLDPTTYEFTNQNINNFNVSASLGTQLFAGMLKLHTLKRSEFNLLASVKDVEKIKNDITISVTTAYLQILYSKEQIEMGKSQIETIESQIENTRQLVQAGSIAAGNLLELEAQLSQEQFNLVSNQNDLINAILTLTQLLELKNANNFDIIVPDLSGIIALEPESDINAIYAIALAMPEIEAEKLRLQAAEKGVSMAKARLYPTLNFSASYGSSYSDARRRPMLDQNGEVFSASYPFFDQISDNASKALALNLQIPIFNSLLASRNVKIARIQKLNQDLALNIAKNTLYKDIQQAYTDARGALNRYRAAESSVLNTREALRYAEQKLKAGMVAPVDYNIARNNFISAQSMMIQAKYEYVFKMKILDFYRGIKITL